MFLRVRSSFLMARALPLAFSALAAQAPLDTLETSSAATATTTTNCRAPPRLVAIRSAAEYRSSERSPGKKGDAAVPE